MGSPPGGHLIKTFGTSAVGHDAWMSHVLVMENARLSARAIPRLATLSSGPPLELAQSPHESALSNGLIMGQVASF